MSGPVDVEDLAAGARPPCAGASTQGPAAVTPGREHGPPDAP